MWKEGFGSWRNFPEAEFLTLQRDEEDTARSLGVTWLPLDVNGAEDFARAASRLRHSRPDALLIGATDQCCAAARLACVGC